MLDLGAECDGVRRRDAVAAEEPLCVAQARRGRAAAATVELDGMCQAREVERATLIAILVPAQQPVAAFGGGGSGANRADDRREVPAREAERGDGLDPLLAGRAQRRRRASAARRHPSHAHDPGKKLPRPLGTRAVQVLLLVLDLAEDAVDRDVAALETVGEIADVGDRERRRERLLANLFRSLLDDARQLDLALAAEQRNARDVVEVAPHRVGARGQHLDLGRLLDLDLDLDRRSLERIDVVGQRLGVDVVLVVVDERDLVLAEKREDVLDAVTGKKVGRQVAADVVERDESLRLANGDQLLHVLAFTKLDRGHRLALRFTCSSSRCASTIAATLPSISAVRIRRKSA